MNEIELVNKKDSYVFTVPTRLISKLGITGDVDLSDDESKVFSYALLLLDMQFSKENINISDLPSVQILFLKDGNFSIKNVSNSYAGATTNVIMYIMDKIRNWSNAHKIIAIFLEELTHHFWNIEDEIIVKHKVLEIMRNFLPELRMEDIYDNGQQYYIH